MFQDKILKSVADAVKDVMAEQLKGDQHKIDKNKNGKVDAHDFKLLRKEEAPKKPASPFDWKNTPRQTAEKGEKTGHDSKKISTGTVYTKRYTKEEASQAEFNAEIKKAQDKSTGKIKADVAKPAVQAVRVEEGIFDSLKRGYTTGLQTGLKKKIKPEHHSSYDIAGVKSTSDATSILQKAKQAGHHINEEFEQIDELSKSTLHSYIGKRGEQVLTAAAQAKYAGKKFSDKEKSKLIKQGNAIDRAVEKHNEEFEQIHELSKTTLGSYIKKASHDVAHKGALTRQFANDSAAAKKDSNYFGAKKADDKSNKMFAKSWKRRENMGKAVDRLTKEEVEINERSLTSGEKTEMEKNVKGMKKNIAGFKERYGKDAKSVMYATATKNAKKD